MISFNEISLENAIADEKLLLKVIQSITPEELDNIERIISMKKLDKKAEDALEKEAAKLEKLTPPIFSPGGGRMKIIREATGPTMSLKTRELRHIYLMGNSVKPVLIFIFMDAYNTDFKSGARPVTQFMTWPIIFQTVFVAMLGKKYVHGEIKIWMNRMALPPPEERKLWCVEHGVLSHNSAQECSALSQEESGTLEPLPKRARTLPTGDQPPLQSYPLSNSTQKSQQGSFLGQAQEAHWDKNGANLPNQQVAQRSISSQNIGSQPVNWTVEEFCDSLQECLGEVMCVPQRLGQSQNQPMRIDIASNIGTIAVPILLGNGPSMLAKFANSTLEVSISLTTFCNFLRNSGSTACVTVAWGFNKVIGIALMPSGIEGTILLTVKGTMALWRATNRERARKMEVE